MDNIVVQDLKKKFGRKEVLCGVSFKLQNGKVYGLLGQNGAGKTTIMKILCGLLKEDAGRIERGQRIVGALIEEPAAYKKLTARENLNIFMNCAAHKDPSRVETVLKEVDLYDEKAKFGQYSLGMKKRLGIAAALLGEPNLLILDEPTAGLDIDGIHSTREIVRNYMKGRDCITLLSSHDTRDIVALCDEIFILHEGRIAAHITDFEQDSMVLEEIYLNVINGRKQL